MKLYEGRICLDKAPLDWGNGENAYKFAEAGDLWRLWSNARAPSAEPASIEQERDIAWLIFFHDHDRKPEIITDEAIALKRFEQISASWNAVLFREYCENSTPGWRERLAAAREAAPASEGMIDDGKLWSLIRRVIEQGTSIQQDYAAGKYPNYEHLSARLDEAARERCDQFSALLRGPFGEKG